MVELICQQYHLLASSFGVHTQHISPDSISIGKLVYIKMGTRISSQLLILVSYQFTLRQLGNSKPMKLCSVRVWPIKNKKPFIAKQIPKEFITNTKVWLKLVWMNGINIFQISFSRAIQICSQNLLKLILKNTVCTNSYEE